VGPDILRIRLNLAKSQIKLEILEPFLIKERYVLDSTGSG
jgi:hypothetical protein